jgi:hypothetical protein
LKVQGAKLRVFKIWGYFQNGGSLGDSLKFQKKKKLLQVGKRETEEAKEKTEEEMLVYAC